MWRHDTRAVARFINKCMETQEDPGPQSQASAQPKVAGNDVTFSLSWRDDL